MNAQRSWLLLLLAVLIGSPAHAALKAWLDSSDIAPGDSVTLTLQHDGRTSSQPELTPLESDFDILETRRSTNIQIVNGRTSAGTQVMLTLSPKRTGHLTLPGITWDGDQSPALALNVTAAPASGGTAAGANPSPGARVFVEATVDPKKPYVQAGVDVTVRLYTAEPLYHANLDLPANSDALVMQVGADENSTAVRNGQQYDVFTRHYIVLPQRSGDIELPGPVLDAQVAVRQRRSDPFGDDDPFEQFFGASPFGGMLTTTKPLRLHGDPIVLSVQPRPATAPGSYWLPARRVTLESHWHPDQLQARVGDPVTVDLHLRAEGLTAEQLPDIAKLLALPAGLKAYPDQPRLQNATQSGTVVGSREESVALIADQPGQFNLPPLRLHWWDVKTNEPRETVLPARTLLILPAATGAGTQSANAPARAPSYASPAPKTASSIHTPAPSSGQTREGGTDLWRWFSLGSTLLWLVTICAWLIWRRRSRQPTQPVRAAPNRSASDVSGSRAAFHAACRSDDALAARRHLLAWAVKVWVDDPPRGLSALAKASENATRAGLLRELDRACFTGTPWRGAPLSNALKELPGPKRRTPERRAELAPLYD